MAKKRLKSRKPGNWVLNHDSLSLEKAYAISCTNWIPDTEASMHAINENDAN